MAQFFTETGRTFTNTTIATMAAMLGWLLIERLRTARPPRWVPPPASSPAWSRSPRPVVRSTSSARIAIGAIAGGVCALAVGLKYKFGLDDSLDVVGVHLVGGIVGTVADRPVLHLATGAGGIDGLFYGGGFGRWATRPSGAVVAIAWSGVAHRDHRLRDQVHDRAGGSRRRTRSTGIDLAEHGESAYDFASLGGGSTGSPERPVLASAQSDAEARGVNA